MKVSDLFNIFGLTGLDKKIITIFLSSSNKVRVPYSRLVSIQKEPRFVENLLSDYFINKQVMWQDFRRETPERCLTSLIDLKSQIDKAYVQLHERPDDGFYASLLLSWGNLCDEAIMGFQTAMEHEAISREIETDCSFVLLASEDIPIILKSIREKSYKIISIFIDLLPDKHPIKDQSNEKLVFGKELLVKSYGSRFSDLDDYDLSIDN